MCVSTPPLPLFGAFSNSPSYVSMECSFLTVTVVVMVYFIVMRMVQLQLKSGSIKVAVLRPS